MARMTGSDFVTFMRGRGFDGFEATDLYRMLNFGYFKIGRLTRWSWEEGEFTLSWPTGISRESLTASFPTLDSIHAVVITTLGHELRLAPINFDQFYNTYGGIDLTQVTLRGEPGQYYQDGKYLYLLPTPIAARDVTIYGSQKLTELTSETTPITPAEYDEAILYAFEEQCHVMARQPEFAAVSARLLNNFLDDALSAETTRNEEKFERVKAGRTWL